jgi:hypothetical protein
MATQGNSVSDRNLTIMCDLASLAKTNLVPQRLRGCVRHWLFFLCLVAVALASSAPLMAQTFAPIPALSFTMGYGENVPLPQLITVTSTGANFGFNATATSTTGGSWLTISPSSFGCCTSTPTAITVMANPAVTLAAGTYTGQILVKADSGTAALTIPVTLVIHPSTVAFFDNVAGGLTFSFQTGGGAPPGQALQIRNAGAGTMAWTATTSTADGGAWLALTAVSGSVTTATPSTITAAVQIARLPGLGITAGTFTGQIVLHTTGDTLTIPITVIVGDSVFRQVNPLNFTKLYAGANPLSQVITVASTGADFGFNATVANSTGGSWLTITPSSYGCCTTTAQAITATVNPAVTLAAGTYSAEIIVRSDTNNMALSIPVTLVINPNTAAFFDDTAGALNFSMETAGDAPPAQALQIRNAGAGALTWTASATTADGHNWLAVTPVSGSAPATVTVTVVPENLPTNGLAAGTFVGQVVLISPTGRLTIPVSLTVGAAVFRQVNPLNFTKVYGGANPLPQVITIASTGADFGFNAVVVDSTGGSWLTITPSSFGCCTSTPQAITVGVNPAVTLAAGTYSAEVVVKANTGGQSLTIPVTLTIQAATTTFFDSLPGQLTFSMLTKGAAPPHQAIEIRNAGTGALSWTATTSTSDGGAWLSIAATSGIAPSAPFVAVNPANLPGGGMTAGTFTGQVILQTTGNRVTIPVTMTVGASVFTQVNGLDFNKVYGGPNPLPQVFTAASTGAAFGFNATAVSATGGSWLVISPSSYGCCTSTPQVITVSVNPAVTLAAGTYTAEVILKSNAGSPSMVVPVSLTINPATVPFFDDMPGGISFFQPTGTTTAPPAQTLRIRNAGTGTLNWNASITTADGGAWLSISAVSGTAPSVLAVAVNPAKLPGLGLTAGIFNGQIQLITTGGRQTIPVSVVVGANVFKTLPGIAFTKAYAGANPAAQVVSVASSGTAFTFTGVASSATGGNWLVISPASYGCCTATPLSLTVSANPATTLAPGIYVAEIILRSNAGDQGMVVPVSLTVTTTAATASTVFTPPGGTYASSQSVVLADATRGAAIYYTIDGTTPTTASRVYAAPIPVIATETIKTLAIAPGYLNSAIGTAIYTITAPQAAVPVVMQTITITEATQGATVYYTTNGTTPTTASARYTGPITLSSSAVLKFIAIAPNYTQSPVRTVTDTIQ